MKKNDGDDTKEPSSSDIKEPSHTDSKKIPEDLVQIQAYIHREKAGKPNYSPDQQLREFEEARNELQMELDKGASLDDIRRKITKGEIKTKVSKHLQGKKYFSIEWIQRQKSDLMHILNKYEAKPVNEKVLSKPRDLTTIELLAKEKEEQDGNPVLNKSGRSTL